MTCLSLRNIKVHRDIVPVSVLYLLSLAEHRILFLSLEHVFLPLKSLCSIVAQIQPGSNIFCTIVRVKPPNQPVS